jgi:hypothetical protein
LLQRLQLQQIAVNPYGLPYGGGGGMQPGMQPGMAFFSAAGMG